MDSNSSINSCNLEFLHDLPPRQPDPPDWEQFSFYKITTLPADPVDYINDLLTTLGEKEYHISNIDREKRVLEERNIIMKEKILRLEAELAEKSNNLQEMTRDASYSKDEWMEDYERLSEAVLQLKTESITRYQEYLDERLNNIVGRELSNLRWKRMTST